MITSTNHVIAGPDFGDIRNIFLPNIGEDQKKKSHDFSSVPLAGTASYYGKSALINALR